MPKDNQIKREDIISKEALNWGDDYAKSVKKALKANKKLINSIAELKEIQNPSELTFAEKEANIFRKRLNLLALIMNTVLDTDQKTKIFNLLQSIEGIDSTKYETMWIKNTNTYLTTVPTVFTEKEIDKMIKDEDGELLQS